VTDSAACRWRTACYALQTMFSAGALEQLALSCMPCEHRQQQCLDPTHCHQFPDAGCTVAAADAGSIDLCEAVWAGMYQHHAAGHPLLLSMHLAPYRCCLLLPTSSHSPRPHPCVPQCSAVYIPTGEQEELDLDEVIRDGHVMILPAGQ
jgi:hypothetical protein